jgi:hypothetical protein
LELELLKFIRKRQELEREENLKAGFTPEEEAPLTFDGKPLSDEDLERLMDLHRKDRGLHLNDIEDEEEYKEAWLEWVKTKVPSNYRINPKPFNEAERFERQMREQRPEFGEMLDHFDSGKPKFVESLLDDEWVPTQRGYEEEMDRAESHIGRYPVGFRHYENYQNYREKFPESTLEDYTNDMNS